MDDLKSKVDNFLKEIVGQYEKWDNFYLNHNIKDDNKKISKLIKEKVEKKSGVYIYLSEIGEILYIGKAKQLSSRLLCHYRESIFEEKDGRKGIAGDTKKGLYPAFFRGKYKGRVKIYWIEINDEYKRRMIELMLQYLHNPKFDEFKKEFNKLNSMHNNATDLSK